MIGFSQPYYVVMEEDGNVVVMIQASGAELEQDVVVNISTHDVTSKGMYTKFETKNHG